MQSNYLKGAFAALMIFLALWILFVQLPKARLQKGLRKLGNMKGKTKEEILQKIGQPKVTQRLDNGQLLSWSAGGYGIQLMFDAEDKVVKITKEVNV